MKGFIERIEEDNVYVLFEDDTFKMFSISDFNCEIKIDMQVEYRDGILTVSEPSEELKDEIDRVTSKIFVPFKDRKKK